MVDEDSCLERWEKWHAERSAAIFTRPMLGPQGHPIRAIEQGNVRVELDLSHQKLLLDIPKRDDIRYGGHFESGDTVEVTVDNVPLLEQDMDASGLSKGQKLGVRETSGGLLLVGTLHHGEPLYGYVDSKHVKFVGNERVLEPRLARCSELFDGRIRFEKVRSVFVSAAILVQKAKQFDDGLYAAVEELAQRGAGHFAGKERMLAALSATLVEARQEDAATLIVLSATRLGQPESKYPASVAEAVRKAILEFHRNELRSKPLGFYTWTPQLTRIFQQDRMLQTEITSKSAAVTLAETLRSNPEWLATYVAYLNLIARLTNPLVGNDLRDLDLLNQLDWSGMPTPRVAFFPPSRSHEGDLVERLRPKSTGDDFDLFSTLIAAVRSGEISLKPTAQSGWYDRQVWSLEPLILPDRMPESNSLILERGYREHLERVFKGTLALMRETHVKQMHGVCGAAGEWEEPPVTIDVAPQLSVEPLPTCFLRRAAAYRFVREQLEATFGSEALQQAQRATATPSVQMPLLEELTWIEELFIGAAVTSALELGMTPEQLSADGLQVGREDLRHRDRFLNWSADLVDDPDVGCDSRMMVPVSYDDVTGRIRVWMFLGWSTETVKCSFAAEPHVQITNGNADVKFESTYKQVWSPVVVETEVTRLLDRDEFRSHCDAYFTREAIVRNLK